MHFISISYAVSRVTTYADSHVLSQKDTTCNANPRHGMDRCIDPTQPWPLHLQRFTSTPFCDHILCCSPQTLEKGKAVSAAMAAADEGPGDWANDIAQYFDDEDEYDEEEELEKFYFSSAAGRARVVLGNRRLGENGYMRAGRMYARPANNNNNGGGGGSSGAGGSSGSSSGNRAAGGNIGKAGKGRAGGAVSGPGASAAAGSGGGGSGGVGAPGQAAAAAAAAAQAKGPGQGRRAKRNARRAAADLSLDGLDLD